MFKICAALCAAVMLAGCGAHKTRQTVVAGEGVGRVPAAGASASAYPIDPGQSELRLLVYRAGPMARLGHNHVILSRALGGWIDAAASTFSIRVPVADFIVDDARARALEGPDFSADVPEEAKLGTRRNMLSAALLDADRFPIITLTSVGIKPADGVPAPGHLVATLAVEVAGHRSTLVVPFMLENSPDRVAASGTAVLRQSEMGLTPFSVMLGALQVQDEVTVIFKLIATKP